MKRRQSVWILHNCLLCGGKLKGINRVSKCPTCNYTMIRWPIMNGDDVCHNL